MPNGFFGRPQPGLMGPRNPQVTRPSEQTEPVGRSVWDRIFQTFAGAPNPLLTAEQNREAQRSALIMAGLQMMAASGPQAVRPNLGAIIAQGAATGQEAGNAARMAAVGVQNAAEMRSLLEGGVNQDVLQQMFARALAAGDIDSARALSEVLKSMGQRQSLQRFTGINPETGEPQIFTFDANGEAIPVTDAQGRPVQPIDTRNPMLDEQRMFSREMQVLRNYASEIEDLQNAYQFIHGAITEAPRAAEGDGPAQVNLLYAFVRAMDPNSVVREGEVRLVEEAASLRQRAIGFYDKVLRGESVVVPADMVDQMEGLMRRMQVEKENHWQNVYDRWSGFATRYGVDEAVLSEVPTRYRAQAGVLAPGGGQGRRPLEEIMR